MSCLVCKKCGADINETIKFCPNCGAHIIHDRSIPINKESISDITLPFNKIVVEDSNNLKVKVIPKTIKFKRKGLIITIGFFMIFLLVGVTVYNMFFKNVANKIVNVPIKKLSQNKQSSTKGKNNNTNLNVIKNTKNQLKNLLKYYTTYSAQAINTNNISLIYPYVVSGSDLYKDQQSYIPSTYKAGIKINIISANITNYNISEDKKSGSINTSLVYNIIAKDGTSSNKVFNYVYEFQYNDSTSNYQFVRFK